MAEPIIRNDGILCKFVVKSMKILCISVILDSSEVLEKSFCFLA